MADETSKVKSFSVDVDNGRPILRRKNTKNAES